MKSIVAFIFALGAWGATCGELHADTLDIQIAASPASLDPQRMNGGPADRIYGDFFEGLVTEDAQGNIVAGQAESWRVSPDGLTYSFQLRDGLAWSDGTPLTAADFVFAFRRLMDPTLASEFAYIQYPLKNARAINTGELSDPSALGVAAVGDRSVIFTLERPTPYFLQALVQPTAYPLPRAIVERFGADWAMPRHIVGNGAYRVIEVAPDLIRGVRNPRYHAAAEVAVDEIAYHVIDDAEVALAAYQSGTIDIATSIPASRLGELLARKPSETRVTPGLGLRYLVLNPALSGLKNVAVRRALSMALDRDQLAAIGGEVPAYGMVPPGTAGFDGAPYRPDWTDRPLEERRRQARTTLRAAGYGPDKPLKLVLRLANIGQQKQFGVAVADMWRAIGVQADILASDIPDHHAALETGDYAAGSIRWILDYDDAGDILTLLQEKHPNHYHAYPNPAVEALLDRARDAGDPEMRSALLRRVERIAMDEVALIPVFWESSRNLVSPSVQGFRDNVRDIHRARWLSLGKRRSAALTGGRQ